MDEKWALSQIFWFIELGVLLHFVISRARKMRNRLSTPASLVWIPLGLAFGLGGAALTAFPRFHDLGRALVLEGMVSALVIGIGAMLVPVVTRAEPPGPASGGARLVQLALAVAFIASFWLQTGTTLPPRVGYAVRLAVALWVLVGGARLWRWPTELGLNRRVVWFAAWCLPLGYGLLTAWPEQRSLGLHVIFLGGFGLLAMAIGQHVIAAHGGRGDWLTGWPKASWLMVGSMALAVLARVAMQLDAPRYLDWMTFGALAFIAAGLAWLWGMAPMVLRGSGSSGH